MRVSEVMRTYPRTISARETIGVARDLMVWSGIRHLPVMRDGLLVGVLTERDVLDYQAQLGEGPRGGLRDTVDRAMHAHPQTCGPNDSLTEIAGRLAESRIGCLPVTGATGQLLGILTVTDVLEGEVRSAMMPSSVGPTVADAMTRDPIVVHPDDYLLDAAARMRRSQIRHLPVVDARNVLVGMLSDRDVRSAIGSPTIAFEHGIPAPKIQLMRVEDAMSRPGISVDPTERCVEVARHFTDLAVSALAVTDPRDRVIGMLSYVDLLRALSA